MQKRLACERYADALPRHGFHGHIPALGWPGYFRQGASFRRSFFVLSSANIFFRHPFSSRIGDIVVFIEAAMPPNFER